MSDADASPPAISVVMPAFDASATIQAAIRSALEQTERSIEIIVVDDVSRDDTAAIAERMASADSRLRVMRMARNGGPAAARNRGIAEARGTWIALLDADDRFAPSRLATLRVIGEARGADMVSDNLMLCPDGRDEGAQVMIPPELVHETRELPMREFIERNIGDRRHPRVSFGFMKPLFRRAFLDEHAIRYEEANRFGEDFLLYVRCLHHGARWWITPEPLYLYAVRRGSLTEVQTSDDLDRIRRMEQRLVDDPRIAADAALRRALLRHKSKIDRSYHYRAFTDAVKARALGRAAKLLLGSPGAMTDVLREATVQTPTIVAKALRGGYRRPAQQRGS